MQLPEPSFDIEEIVYYRVTKQKGIIVSLLIRKRDMLYGVNWGPNYFDWAYDFELSKDPVYDTTYDSLT